MKFKTETVEEFLARGGKINKAAPGKKQTKGKTKVEAPADIDYSALPKALRIKLGV